MSLITRQSSVVVADPSSSVRMTLLSVLRGFGYEQVVAVAALDEVLDMMAKSKVDWLITSAYVDAKVNALHILRIQNAPLISLCYTEQESSIVDRAFALGLFSSHRKQSAKEAFRAEMDQLFDYIKQGEENATLIAAHYLRDRLRAQCRFEEVLAFDAALVKAVPDRVEPLLALAESCFETGDDQRARALIWQVEQRDSSKVDVARELGDRFQGGEADRRWGSLRPGICAVIDPDPAAVQHTVKGLEQCQAQHTHAFSDGDEFWKWIEMSGTEPELIIMEWRIPKVTGPALLQRLRARGIHMPVIVLQTSLVKRSDQPLLEEMGIHAILEKPAAKAVMLNCLAWAVSQARRPTDMKSLEQKIKALLRSNQLEEAAKLMRHITQKVDVLDPMRRMLEAEFAFYAGDFNAARDMAMSCLAAGDKTVGTLNLLGKSLMKLRDFKAALQVLERANDMSPNSVERLCAIAESSSELGDNDTAKTTLGKACAVDSENQYVINASVNIGLASGDQALAGEMISKVLPSDSVLAYINNRAVAFAKIGNFHDSIGLYNNAILALPANRADLRAIVCYNMALAQIQNGDSAGALTTLKTIAGTVPDDSLGQKIDSLLHRTEVAQSRGSAPRLNKAASPKKAAKGAADMAAERFAKLRERYDVETAPNVVLAVDARCLAGIYQESVPSALADALLLAPMPNVGRKGA